MDEENSKIKQDLRSRRAKGPKAITAEEFQNGKKFLLLAEKNLKLLKIKIVADKQFEKLKTLAAKFYLCYSTSSMDEIEERSREFNDFIKYELVSSDEVCK
jgi:hypothetical protein